MSLFLGSIATFHLTGTLLSRPRPSEKARQDKEIDDILDNLGSHDSIIDTSDEDEAGDADEVDGILG